MEKSRRLYKGRLSEIMGETTLDLDVSFRHLGFADIAEEIFKKMSKQEKEVLTAYANGVNSFVEKVGFFKEDNSAHSLPPEFLIFKIEWEPWTP